MEENEVLAPEEELTPDQGDAFLDGWEGKREVSGDEGAPDQEDGERSQPPTGQEQSDDLPRAEKEPAKAAANESVTAQTGAGAGRPKEAVADGKPQRQQGGGARIARDIAQFAEVFPEIYDQARKDTGLIPESVWKEVGAGKTLATAYARYAVEQAAAQAQAAAQNHKNAQRATGSMRSAGSDAKSKDSFLAGFDE